MILERLLIVLVLALVCCGTYTVFTRYQVRRLARIDADDDPILARLQRGVPAVVYFTTPGCMPCITQQVPALEALQQALGEGVQIIKVDATEEPDSADKWGVMAAPTTFIIDANGHTRMVNHGVAEIDKLLKQLGYAG